MASSGEIEKLERRWAENQLGLTFAPLAEAYRKAGDPARALSLLQIGMAQHPNYVPAHIVQGRCHLDTQSDGDAELSFLRVTELDPENVIALKVLAEISERAGRLPEAIRRLETLLDVDRNNEEARGQLDRVREVSSALASVPAEPVSAAPPSRIEAAAETPVAHEAAPEPPVEMPSVSAEAPEESASDFRLRSDAETLLPSQDRLEDVLLSEETLLDVPEFTDAEEAEARVLSVGDFESPTAFEPPVEEPVGEPEESLSEEAPEPEPAAAPEPLPMVMEVAVPLVDVVPPPPPPPPDDSYESTLPVHGEPEAVEEPVTAAAAPSAWEPEPEPEPDLEPELESEPAAAPAAQAEPELVVTETMAEIFLRQGHRELALAVYTQLAQRDPANERIAATAASLQQELTPPAPPPPPAPPVPVFGAKDTGGRSVRTLFGSLLAATRPAVATPVHPPAFEPPRRSAGEPTRPSQDALSLSAVFGDEPAPGGPAAGPADASPVGPTFDEFFAAGSSADSELPKPPGSESAAAASQVPEDLEQFNAWLRGLKR